MRSEEEIEAAIDRAKNEAAAASSQFVLGAVAEIPQSILDYIVHLARATAYAWVLEIEHDAGKLAGEVRERRRRN